MRSFFSILPHILGIALVIGAVVFVYLNYHFQPDPIKIVYDNIYLDEREEAARDIQVSGAVLKPGIYSAYPGNTINDLIDQAGGLTIEADLSGLNIAQLAETDQIVIPSTFDFDISRSSSNLSDQNETGLVNLNLASQEQLIELPGIGEKTADKIIDYRASQPFQDIEEIMEVDGIGESKFSQIKDLITI